MRKLRTLDWDQDGLRMAWTDGSDSAFPSLWLRDNCPEDRDAGNGQRLIDIADLPESPRLTAVETAGDRLRLRWQGESRAGEFSLDWLEQNDPARAGNRPGKFRLWAQGAALDARRDFAWGHAAELAADTDARRAWLARLVGDGLAFLDQVPPEHHAMLPALVVAGQVMPTNYGLVFDVRTEARPENLAYSDLGLGLHTDNPYREPVPGFQALHCLIAAPDGGDTLLADGFAIAEELRRDSPDDFEVLTTTPVTFRYGSRDAELVAERPLIETDARGELRAVHYNNRSIAPLRLPAASLPAFYTAYRRLANLLREPRYMLRLRLASGELMLFDNRRVLHGRTAFSSARHPRHLQGCYLTRDSVFGSLALLERKARHAEQTAGLAAQAMHGAAAT